MLMWFMNATNTASFYRSAYGLQQHRRNVSAVSLWRRGTP